MREQHVVHGPEFMLRARSFRGFGRLLGMGMNGGEWEMAEDVLHVAVHAVEDSRYDLVGSAAKWAFVVAILDQRDRRVRRSANMVAALRHGQGQCRSPSCHAHDRLLFCLSFSMPSSACRMPSAPGFKPTGET